MNRTKKEEEEGAFEKKNLLSNVVVVVISSRLNIIQIYTCALEKSYKFFSHHSRAE
jgi:hypothetical protein